MKVYSYIEGRIVDMYPCIDYSNGGKGKLTGFARPDCINIEIPVELFEIPKFSLWHDGSEKPKTGRIFYESIDEGGIVTGTADYDAENDRFDSDNECYWSGKWEDCHIKRWIYEQDLLVLK